MITEIGIVSGLILELLEDKRTPMSIVEIKLHLDASRDLMNMAIGWLIREKYVQVTTKGTENYLSLTPTHVIYSAISGKNLFVNTV